MKHTYSIEVLWHFNCWKCCRWFSISEFHHEIKLDTVTCPWCGTKAHFEEKSNFLKDTI